MSRQFVPKKLSAALRSEKKYLTPKKTIPPFFKLNGCSLSARVMYLQTPEFYIFYLGRCINALLLLLYILHVTSDSPLNIRNKSLIRILCDRGVDSNSPKISSEIDRWRCGLVRFWYELFSVSIVCVSYVR